MRAVAVTIAAVSLGLLTACTADPSGPQRLSPSIAADPIDLSEFAAAPCGLMPADQLAHYFITAPGIVRGPACLWIPGDTSQLTYQASVDLTSGGLENLYRHRTAIAGFDPTDVHSYPGIHRDTGAGRCTVDVGVANDTILAVTVAASDPQLSAYGDPCGEADRFAGTVIGYQGHRAP